MLYQRGYLPVRNGASRSLPSLMLRQSLTLFRLAAALLFLPHYTWSFG